MYVDRSPAVKILAVATLIYNNAVPNGPCPGRYRVSSARKRSTDDHAIPPPRPGALGASSTPYAPLRLEHDAIEAQQQTVLNVAPPPVQAVECLQARKTENKNNASAARPREEREREVCDERDP